MGGHDILTLEIDHVPVGSQVLTPPYGRKTDCCHDDVESPSSTDRSRRYCVSSPVIIERVSARRKLCWSASKTQTLCARHYRLYAQIKTVEDLKNERNQIGW